MCKAKWARIIKSVCRPQGFLLLLLPSLVFTTLFLLSTTNHTELNSELDYEWLAYLISKIDFKSAEIVDGYLVWNPKCHLVSKNPLDLSIIKYVKKEKYQSCSESPPITKIIRESDGKNYLVMVTEQIERYKYITCCYAPVYRRNGPYGYDDETVDSELRMGECKNFEDKALLNNTIEVVLVQCRASKVRKPSYGKSSNLFILDYLFSETIYSNVHAVLNPAKVQKKLVNTSDNSYKNRKLSILVIGIDSVSRLNFQRTMPLTKEYLDKRGWLELRGYNKMGYNTYPNLMALITGLDETTVESTCDTSKTYGLNKCPMIWNPFRDAGYVTGYGEDTSEISTFNLFKRGFADPPTDYYLRPYMVAAENFLNSKYYFGTKYCAGPEVSFFRILDYAQEFAKTFINQPYFGFFWTNSVSHDNLNAPSSIDDKFLNRIQEMEKAGVMNDSMVIILSDHGWHFGNFRSTIIGWYEDRLPTVYISLPPWFREQNPEAYLALSINRNRLTSPYDLYETLRDILLKAGGSAPKSPSCPNCMSLFKTVPNVRGCSDVGVDENWCACNSFQNVSTTDKIILEGAHKFLEFVDNIVKYYTENGKRQCEKFRLKKIHRASQTKDFQNKNNKALEFFYLLEVEPGGAMFETTVKYYGEGNYVFREQDISRVNMYKKGAACLTKGKKMFCECVT